MNFNQKKYTLNLISLNFIMSLILKYNTSILKINTLFVYSSYFLIIMPVLIFLYSSISNYYSNLSFVKSNDTVINSFTTINHLIDNIPNHKLYELFWISFSSTILSPFIIYFLI